nr:hypothetical protein [uncultured Oscillibacter sp.]
MYEVGALVLYDKRGVYKIDSVGLPPVRGTTGDYYKLCAVFSNSNEIIYAPVDMTSSMRPLISGGEAAHYLELFSQLEPHVFLSGKTMELAAHYQGMLASRKVEDCLLLIKEIHVRQREMAQQKKQLGQVDIRYLKLAEKLICEEFAVALNTAPDLIRERLYAAAECKASA